MDPAADEELRTQNGFIFQMGIAGDMKMFTIANLVNLAIRVSVSMTLAPQFGIAFVWCAVPVGWFANWIISFAQYKTGKWRAA